MEDLILTDVFDIDQKIILYLDLESFDKLINFKNIRKIIIKIFPDIVKDLLINYPDEKKKEILRNRNNLTEFYGYKLLKLITTITLRLVSYHEPDILNQINILFDKLIKPNIFYVYLLSLIFKDVFNENPYFCNEVCLYEIYKYYVDSTDWHNFIEQINKLLRNKNFNPDTFFISISGYNKSRLQNNDLFRIMNIFLKPAIQVKNSCIIEYFIDYWKMARHDFEDIKLKEKMDNIIINAVKILFQI